jgi:hypothetical protein
MEPELDGYGMHSACPHPRANVDERGTRDSDLQHASLESRGEEGTVWSGRNCLGARAAGFAPVAPPLAVAFAVVALDVRVAFSAPTLRATVETALTACGLVSAMLLGARFRHRRRVSDVLMLVALSAPPGGRVHAWP